MYGLEHPADWTSSTAKQKPSFIISPETGNPNSLSGTRVNSILEDNQGNIWAGTFENGLNKFNRETGQFTRYRYDSKNKETISNNSILSIYQDTQGNIWIGTGGGGLNLYHPETDTFTYYLKKMDFQWRGLWHSGGCRWLSLDEHELWDFALYSKTGTFRNFDAGDGLQSNEFNSGAYARGRNGELYFGGIEGLTVFYPSNIEETLIFPRYAYLPHAG